MNRLRPRPLVRGVRGRSVFYLLVLAVGLVYAIVAGHWGSVVNLLLRVA